jgi:hypothetical protein
LEAQLFTASNGVVGAAPDFVVGAEPGERMADGTGRAIQIAAVFADVDGTLVTKDKVLTSRAIQDIARRAGSLPDLTEPPSQG